MPSRATDSLRTAVAAGAYLEAEELLIAYRHEVEARWKSANSLEERQAIATEVTDLMEWARQTILVARAHAQGKLIQFSRQGAYAGNGARKQERLELDA
jgi:hypothetical protein